jgi:hypothetical protein
MDDILDVERSLQKLFDRINFVAAVGVPVVVTRIDNDDDVEDSQKDAAAAVRGDLAFVFGDGHTLFKYAVTGFTTIISLLLLLLLLVVLVVGRVIIILLLLDDDDLEKDGWVEVDDADADADEYRCRNAATVPT